MKKIIILLILIGSVSTLLAQSPESFSYQAVLRNNSGQLLENQLLTATFILHQTNPGNAVYSEQKILNTNQFGLFTHAVGTGVSSDDFSLIDWSIGPFFLEVQVDIGAGAISMGTQQLLSVPYSLFAKKAESVSDLGPAGGDLSGMLPDPTVVQIQNQPVSATFPATDEVLKWNGSEWAPSQDNVASGGGAVNTTARFSGDGSTTNPLDLAPQSASSGEVLKWNGSSWAPAPDQVDDADADATNELQNLSLSGTQLSLSNGGGSVSLPPGTTYTSGTGINISGNVINNSAPDQPLGLSGSGATTISGTYPNFTVSSTDNVDDADADATNELQSLSLSGTQLSLSNAGGTVTLPTGTTYTSGTGISISGNVISNSSPDQTVSLSGSGATSISGSYPNFSISSTDNVNDADADASNELQNLSISGSDLSLSNGGGTVTLPTAPTYSGGTGISVSGTTINNTAPDQTVSLSGSGATSVSGSYPNFSISSTDNVNDADADASNELQNLSISGSDLSLSNGGGTVTLPTAPTYSGGTGISVSGTTINNTAPDQTVSLSGSGATSVSGSYPNFSISSTDNVNDADADASNELQNLSISGSDLSLSNGGGTVTLPTAPTYSGGTGISVSGTTINNTAPDQTVSLSGSGATSVSGSYPNFSISSTDNVNDADADASNELQNLSISGSDLSLSNGGGTVTLPTAPTYSGGTGISVSGTTINNTAPDQTVSLSGSGATSVSGSYPNFSISSTDNVNDADANPNNELQSLSLSGTTLSLSDGGGSVSMAPFVSPWTSSGSNIYRTSGNIGIGTTNPVTALQVYANRDILGGSSMAGNGAKMIWDYSSRAFRAGYAAASSWNEDSIGLYSSAFGFGTVAQAYMSSATGFYTHSRTYAGFSIGRYNAGAAGNATSWTTTDPLFEVGNGTSNTNRNNAFTIRKDGRVGINDATPDYLLDIENPELSLRSIYINHDISTSSSTMYGVYVNADNTAANSGVSYAGYFDMTNNNDDAYGIYSLAFCDATDGSPAYAVRSYVDNDNGSGWAYAIYGSVSGSTTGSKYAGYFNGHVYTTGSYLPSDRSLKREIQPMGQALDKVLALSVASYQYDHGSYPQMNFPKGQRVGFLADELAQIMPELVVDAVQPAQEADEMEDGEVPGAEVHFQAVDYASMVPYLVKAIQEQQAEIERLKARLDRMEP